MIIKLLEQANPDDKKNILKLMNSNNQDQNKINFITDMMIKYKIDKISKNKMDSFFNEGIELLNNISGNIESIKDLKSYFEKIRKRNF